MPLKHSNLRHVQHRPALGLTHLSATLPPDTAHLPKAFSSVFPVTQLSLNVPRALPSPVPFHFFILLLCLTLCNMLYRLLLHHGHCLLSNPRKGEIAVYFVLIFSQNLSQCLPQSRDSVNIDLIK